MAFPGFNLDAISDEDLTHLTAGAAPPTKAPAAEPEVKEPQGFNVDDLSDKQIAQLTHGAKPAMGTGEAAARSFYKHLTFGTQPFADREKAKQAAEEHPYVDLGTGAGAMLAQTAALGPVAAYAKGVQAAGALGTAARGAGTALEYTMLPNLEANTALTAGRTGAKLAGNYSGLEAAGAGLTDPDKSLGEVAKDVGTAYATGTALGAPLGAGAHGVSRLFGAAANRMFPALKEVREAAFAPEAQGARDITRYASYDKYTPEDFAKLRQNLADPDQAHKYADLNLIEALETSNLKPMAGTGELKPELKVSPNLRDAAQDFAQTQGRGRQEAIEAFANRKNEMPAKIQADIDRLFTDPEVAALERQFGGMPKQPEIEMLPKAIDRHFGSGDGEADAAALAARQTRLGARYERLKSKPLQQIEELGRVAQSIPEFNSALNYAARNDMIRLAETGAEWSKPWSAGELGKTIQTLSPTNILDIHHALVMNAKPRVGGDPTEMMMAGKLKNWFSNWVDNQFKGHEALRGDYAVFKRTMEASELGGKLPVTGAADHPAMKFYNQAVSDYEASAKSLARRIAAYDKTMARYQSGQIKNPPKPTDLNNEIAATEGKRGVLEAFRKSWGESLKQDIASSINPESAIKKWLTPAGRERIMQVAGEKEGPAFLNSLLVLDARNQGMSLGLSAGGSDHAALQFFDKAVREGRTDVVDAFRKAWGDRIKQELASATAGPNAVVTKLLTQEGKDRILKILGPEKGREFIESLYNKAMQNGFSKTLFGGPDTAYKLARNQKKDALMDAVHGLFHLRPMQTIKALGEMGSSQYKQMRADQANQLLSRQGPEDLTKIIDGIVANEKLRSTAHPYVRNPALTATGPVGANGLTPLLPEEHRRAGLPPYKP